MKKRILLFSLLLNTIVYGQTNSTKEEVKPYIEVTGTAEKQITPDEIFIKFSINEKYEKGVKISIEAQENKLKAGLSSLNLSLADLSISDADLDYVRIHIFKKDIVSKKDYTLKVSNSKSIENVYNLLQNIEIKDAFISKVSHSKIDSLKKEVKIIAIKAAKDKATYLLEAIGEKLGKPLLIQEKEISQNLSSNYLNVGGGLNNNVTYYVDGTKTKYESLSESVQFEKIKIQASFYIKYSIQ